MAGRMKTPFVTEVDFGLGHIVLDGVPAPARGAQQGPLFSVHVCCGHFRPSRLLLSSCTNGPQIKKGLECWPMPNVMAAKPNIGGAVCDAYVIPFLVPRCTVWLTPAAGVPCSNTARIGERKNWTHSEVCTWQNSIRGHNTPICYRQAAQDNGPIAYGKPFLSDRF